MLGRGMGGAGRLYGGDLGIFLGCSYLELRFVGIYVMRLL